jgi:muconolactone D-isomerase
VEFLVRIEVDLPPDMEGERLAALVDAERVRGRELVAEGRIVRIWRLPGGLRNVGVWSAADATELHELLMSLPTRPWFRATVEALAVHPLEARDG